MLEHQTGKQSIFNILMKPMSPTIIHMYDVAAPPEPAPPPEPATLAPLGDATLESATLAPLGDATLESATLASATLAPLGDATLESATLEPPTPPTTPETPKPVVFVTPMRYEFHTVVVLKKWWAAISCKSCKSVEAVGFPVTRHN